MINATQIDDNDHPQVNRLQIDDEDDDDKQTVNEAQPSRNRSTF